MSKIISGVRNVQAVLLKSGTAFGTRVGDAFRMRARVAQVQAPEGTVFYAPLTNTVNDVVAGVSGVASRASPAQVWNGSGWSTAAVNQPRFGSPYAQGEYLMEPRRENLFLNSAAPATQVITLGTGLHTLSVYGPGVGTMTSSDGTGTATGHGTATDGAPVTINVTGAGTFNCTIAGTPTYAQVEAGYLSTSPIITAGTSAVREEDRLYWDSASFWNQPENTTLFYLRPQHPRSVIPTGFLSNVMTLSSEASRFIYWQSPGTTLQFRIHDGSSVAAANILGYDAGEQIKYAAHAGLIAGDKDCGTKRTIEGWRWATVNAYDGAFNDDGRLTVQFSIDVNVQISGLAIYDVDQDRAWIDANFPDPP